MHVQQTPRSGTLMQIIDILGDQQKFAPPFRIEPRERLVRYIGLNMSKGRAPRIVECLHKRRIACERLGCRDILNAMTLPKPVWPAKCWHSRFS